MYSLHFRLIGGGISVVIVIDSDVWIEKHEFVMVSNKMKLSRDIVKTTLEITVAYKDTFQKKKMISSSFE